VVTTSSKKVRAEAFGGQHSRSSQLTIFHSKQRQAPVHTALLGFLLKTCIYLNDLCIYIIGVYWNPRNALLLFPGYPWSYHGGNPLEWLYLVIQDHGRSRVAGSTSEISGLCSLLDRVVGYKVMRTLIWDQARKLSVGMWRILDGKVESGLIYRTPLWIILWDSFNIIG
jgi:hypothetical protein